MRRGWMVLVVAVAASCGTGDGNGPDEAAPDATDAASDADDRDVPEPGDVPADVPVDPGPPPFQPGGCGMTPYAWLPSDQVGTLVSWEEDPTWAQTREVLEAALVGAGFGAAAPLDYGTRMYQIRYVTQDRGVKREATALVAVPQREDGAGADWPIILWMHGTSGVGKDCAPSRGIEGNALAALWAATGYISVAPDYLGLVGFGGDTGIQHPYLVGEPSAIAAWDAVRAAYALLQSGQITDEPARPVAKVIPWGGSQGGHAALWAHRLARWYAPEFEVPATVALTPPADLMGESEKAIRESREAMSNLSAFLVAAARWYGREDVLADALRDEEPDRRLTTFLADLEGRCDFWQSLVGVSSADFFTPAFLQGLEDPGLADMDPWGCWFQANTLTTTTVPRGSDAPVLVVQAGADTRLDTATERAAVTRMCQQGYTIQYLECAGALHPEASFWSMPEQKAWVKDRLVGKPLDAAATCVVTPAVRCAGQPVAR